jgi:hypothetical protein
MCWARMDARTLGTRLPFPLPSPELQRMPRRGEMKHAPSGVVRLSFRLDPLLETGPRRQQVDEHRKVKERDRRIADLAP